MSSGDTSLNSAAPLPRQFLPELLLSEVIEAAWNPRKRFDAAELDDLVMSIRQKGVLEPIVVRPLAVVKKGAKFEIVAGSRRARAAKVAGLASIPAIQIALSDVEALEVAIIENQQRADIHPVEEARGYAALIKADKRYTAATVAARVGKSETFVRRRLKLLELEAPLAEALLEDRLSVEHAYRLLRLSPAKRKEAADLDGGVVWRRPILSDVEERRAGRWVPRAEDLNPLAALDEFIRRHAAVDLRDPSIVHMQPGLEQAIADRGLALGVGTAEDDTETEATPAEATEQLLAGMVALSDDPFCRSAIDAKKDEPVPLTPAKWRVQKAGKECAHVVNGAVVHGGPFRILRVCVTRSCRVHFPVAKKKKAAPAPAPAESVYQRENRLRAAREAAWAAAVEAIVPAVVKKAKASKLKLSPALLRLVLSAWDIRETKEAYGIELSARSMPAFLFLVAFHRARRSYCAEKEIRGLARLVGVNTKPIEKRVAAERKKAAKVNGAAVDKAGA